jgi:thiosulfate/3-mercaptopyruvate sulfurtransferase
MTPGIETAELAERLGEPSLVILDVRTLEEYAGLRGYPCDARQGHIPGARHLPVIELVSLGLEEIRAHVEIPEGGEIVAYCHSGGRSALAVSILRSAGLTARNYEGSWHAWSQRDELPAATAR